ncbi:MAG: hypothetical protein JSW52_07760 [Candidatus Coatesbacteria bacterium]|nr:MAG: hypothetical protein JSW52_07760 [Candidatus Coatesbacteria bacterium]
MRPITLLTVIFIIATLIACDEDTIRSQGDNTPADVLELLEESSNRGAISVLDGVLSTDFVFYFDLNDIGTFVGDYMIPTFWNRDYFMRACGNMFDLAYLINFDIVTTGIENPEEGATTFEVYNVHIRFLVMIDANNGFTANGVCDFEFTNDTSAGYDDWKVSKWYDDTSPRGSAGLSSTGTPTSLGNILASFY